MKYKIGDKVKVVKALEPLQDSMKAFIGQHGIIKGVKSGEFSCPINVEFDIKTIHFGNIVSFKKEELEIYNEVGKQLEFSFMSD